METMTSVGANAGLDAGSVGSNGSAGIGRLRLEIQHVESGDAAEFRAALDRYMNPGAANGLSGPGADRKVSLGDRLTNRATNLATEMKKDQEYVSKMLEQASRTGDSMQLMKAMMALNDYQVRVQTIAKTVSKATQAFEQLTKLQ